jgi:hypothetical protein
MHRFRRHAHRAATGPRRGWQRAYSYRRDRIPGSGLNVTTPMSRDAPWSDEDAAFWEWILLAVLMIAVVVGVLLVAF